MEKEYQMRNIGIMQGRLSPAQECRLQFFPNNWQEEFYLAEEAGFENIEWLFDWQDWEENPILCEDQMHCARILSAKTGVKISSVCADYFMRHGFWGSEAQESVRVLRWLISASAKFGIRNIVVPILEEMAINSQAQEDEITANLGTVGAQAEHLGVTIAFETELNDENLKRFILALDSSAFGVCYDLGNATSYGYRCAKDIQFLGRLISEVHIKDRKIGSSQSVYLGDGDVDFDGCFAAFESVGFWGPYILQASRGEDYLGDAKRQLDFVKECMAKRSE